MIEPEYMPLVTWGASFVVAVAGGMIGTTWRVGVAVGKHDGIITQQISELRSTVVDMMNKHEQLDLERFAKVDSKLDENADTIRREFGETGHALREELHTMKLAASETNTKNLDTFLRRASFYEVMKEMGDDLKGLVAKVDIMALDLASRPRRSSN